MDAASRTVYITWLRLQRGPEEEAELLDLVHTHFTVWRVFSAVTSQLLKIHHAGLLISSDSQNRLLIFCVEDNENHKLFAVQLSRTTANFWYFVLFSIKCGHWMFCPHPNSWNIPTRNEKGVKDIKDLWGSTGIWILEHVIFWFLHVCYLKKQRMWFTISGQAGLLAVC